MYCFCNFFKCLFCFWGFAKSNWRNLFLKILKHSGKRLTHRISRQKFPKIPLGGVVEFLKITEFYNFSHEKKKTIINQFWASFFFLALNLALILSSVLLLWRCLTYGKQLVFQKVSKLCNFTVFSCFSNHIFHHHHHYCIDYFLRQRLTM